MTFEHPSMLFLLAGAPLAAASAWHLARAKAISRARAWVLGSLLAIAVTASALASAGPRRDASATPPTRGVLIADLSASMTDADRRNATTLLSRAESDPNVIARLHVTSRPGPYLRTSVAPVAPGADPAPGSDPAAALDAARALLDASPAAGPRRVFLVSDGAETSGDLAAAAERLRAAGIALDVRVAGDPTDRAIVALDAPAVARSGEPVVITVRVASGPAVAPAARARAILRVDGKEVASRDLALSPGEQPVVFTWRASSAGNGIRHVSVSLDAGDARPANDVAEHVLEVLPPPRILLVSARPAAEPSAAEQGFAAAGIGVTRVTPDAMPAAASALAGRPAPGEGWGPRRDAPGNFDVVVLEAVDAPALGAARIAALSGFVRAGGGLIAFPGSEGLAKGGSPEAKALRRILPLATVDDEKKEPPPVAMVFILDKSDSMHRERKWEAASRTTASAFADINPSSTIGLLTFSDFTQWVVPMAKAKEVPDFPAKVLGIRLSGGTNMFPSLGEAFAALAPLDARLKHIVLLSDGVSVTRLADHEALIEKLRLARITVSTVAMGSEADQPTMEAIARATGGRYWFVSDPNELPRIFAEETKQTAKEDVEPAPLTALRAKTLPALAGVDPASIGWTPTTHTRTRASAETIWMLDAPDVEDGNSTAKRPLLARARVGEGTAIAMAAPAEAARLPAATLWGGLAASSVRAPGAAPRLRATASPARIEITREEPGALEPGYSVELENVRIPLDATALDRAAADFPNTKTNTTTHTDTDTKTASASSSPVQLARILDPSGRPVAWLTIPDPSAAEHAPTFAAATRLESLARATGGDVIPPGEIAAWMGHAPPEGRRPLSVPLGLLALSAAAGAVLARRPPRLTPLPRRD